MVIKTTGNGNVISNAITVFDDSASIVDRPSTKPDFSYIGSVEAAC